ncbi:MerR family transcriptional regulator, partial [Roseicyclus sp.]|uniref:MerR family transcriptional regulator n=1 Tax=Roseicyclus sp. TaxID=1914329 RepID=UPI003FA09A1E
MSKSPDAFRTIREVADWLGVAAHVLRFWESKFSQIRPVKRAGGRRYYRPADMELVGGIKVLLHDRGMTVRGVQRLLREEGVATVAALSPPLDTLRVAPELIEGIGAETAWQEDAAAEAQDEGEDAYLGEEAEVYDQDDAAEDAAEDTVEEAQPEDDGPEQAEEDAFEEDAEPEKEEPEDAEPEAAQDMAEPEIAGDFAEERAEEVAGDSDAAPLAAE